jgi:hypothetical protein
VKLEGSNNINFLGWDPTTNEWHGVTHARYTGDPSDSQVRWGSCGDPRGKLTPGEVYELDTVRVHSWHTKITLVGIDTERGFNSVSFEPVSPEAAE